MASKDTANSVIGAGSAFEGKFYVSGSLEIHGKFEGDIHTQGQLVIAESGKVKTNIIAKRVTLGGTLIGNINASEEVILLSTGRMMGNISAPVVHIDKGALTHGEVHLTGGQTKDVSKLIKDSFASTPGVDHFTKNEEKEKNKKFPL